MKTLFTTLLFCIAHLSFSQNDTEWDDYFMPGAGYKLYIPKNQKDLGIYHGLMTEFVIYARAKGTNSRKTGPARIKTYGNFSIMKSELSTAKDIFFTTVGLNLSLEGNTNRKFMIPYFGLEWGGLFQRDFSTLQFTPHIGFQIISTKTILWNVQGGYQYTIKKFDEYSGFMCSTNFNILLWNKEKK
jgi:hypothetical protein